VRVAERAFGAHDALRDGGLGDQEGARDSSVVSPASSRSVSAVLASVDNSGWQAMNISRSRSSPISSSALASNLPPLLCRSISSS